jgi:uncharacterized protein DUF1579
MRKTIVPLLLLCLIALPLMAQTPSIPDQREAMKKLDFMVGQWKGEGWHERPPGPRTTFTQTENVQKKVDGLALLVEGKGTGKDGAGNFEAMGVISYDDQARRYRFVTNTSEGRHGDFELKLTERGWEWGFALPQGGRVRYTMKLTDDGQWLEIGEYSQDEKTWRRFHEMTLRRMP